MASSEHAAHSTRVGMWAFLASEILFFGALFVLYAAYRSRYAAEFTQAARESAFYLGSLNTGVLLTSSFCLVRAVVALERGQRRFALRACSATAALGVLFLIVKGIEYARHWAEGIRLGHAPGPSGAAPFWALYYVITGLHAFHVAIGVVVLGLLARAMRRGALTPENASVLENGALYWHLVDALWLFIWPMFYLLRGGGA